MSKKAISIDSDENPMRPHKVFEYYNSPNGGTHNETKFTPSHNFIIACK